MYSIDVILGCAFIALSIGLAIACYLTRDKKEVKTNEAYSLYE